MTSERRLPSSALLQLLPNVNGAMAHVVLGLPSLTPPHSLVRNLRADMLLFSLSQAPGESNTTAIIGGVVGGVLVGLALAALASWLFLRHRYVLSVHLRSSSY